MRLPSGASTCAPMPALFNPHSTQFIRMFYEGLHITAALSATWLPWFCLALVVLVWLSCMMQPQYLRAVVSNSFAEFAGNTAEQIPSIGSQVAQWLFCSTVPALAVFILVVDSPLYGLEFIEQLVALAILIDLARVVAALMVQYTFRLGRRASLAYACYFSLRSLMSYALFVILMLMAYTTPNAWGIIALAVLIVVYMLILLVQWLRLFNNSLQEMAGVIVYLLTLELLPMWLLYEAGRQVYILHLI